MDKFLDRQCGEKCRSRRAAIRDVQRKNVEGQLRWRISVIKAALLCTSLPTKIDKRTSSLAASVYKYMVTTVSINWYWIDFDPKETKKQIKQKLEAKGANARLFSKAVYVIRLKSPFSINYPDRHTPVLYIGEGSVLSRLVSHRIWAKRLQNLGYPFGLEVAVCFPLVRNSPVAYKNFEAHLLKVFFRRYGSLPLKNSIKETMAIDHQYNRVATSGILGPGSGTRHKWAIQPLPSNPFQDVFKRTHA